MVYIHRHVNVQVSVFPNIPQSDQSSCKCWQSAIKQFISWSREIKSQLLQWRCLRALLQQRQQMYPDSSPTRSCIKLRSDVVLESYNPRRQKHRCVLLLWICLRNQEAMHYVWLRWHAIQTRCLSRTPAETGWDHFLRCVFLESRQVLCDTPTLGASNVSLLNSNLFLNPGLSGGCVCVCVFSVLIGSEHQQMASGVLCWCRTSRYRLLSSGPGSSQPFVMMLSLPAQDKVISSAKDSSWRSSLFNEQPAVPCPASPSLSATPAPAPGHCPQLCYSVAVFTSEPGYAWVNTAQEPRTRNLERAVNSIEMDLRCVF